MSNTKPIDKIERFPVEASFFEGSNEDKSWVNTSISKVYEKDGKWHRTNNFSGNDLLKLNAMMPDVIARQHELETGQPQEENQGSNMDELRERAQNRRARSQGQAQDQGHSL